MDVKSLRIVLYPDPVLQRRAAPIESIDEEIRSVAERMIELMHEAEGVGLAAPQVGLGWRMFVANPSGEAGGDRVFINPELRDAAERVEAENEGCLSLPGVSAEIRRPAAITIEATDLEGRPFTLSSEELPARVWQHETDHLNGVLILDRMGPLDKRANRKAIKQLESRGETLAKKRR